MYNSNINSEILAKPPRWIIVWGTSVLFFIFFIVLLVSNFVHYPDKLTASAKITTLNPQIDILAQSDGELVYLPFVNGEEVQKNVILGVIKSNSDYNKILRLDTFLNTIIRNSYDINSDSIFHLLSNYSVYDLGEIIESYSIFLTSIEKAIYFSKNNSYKTNYKLLSNELIQNIYLLSKFRIQKSNKIEELVLAKNDLNRDLYLFKNNVITIREFENKQKIVLSLKNNIEEYDILYSNTMIRIQNLKKQINDIKLEYKNDSLQLNIVFQQSTKSLINLINSWKIKYILKSPINGTVSYTKSWNISKNISKGEVLLTLIPKNRKKIIAILKVSASNAGKIKIGQFVNISLNDFPAYEYGIIKGIVNKISLSADEHGYLIDVSLPDGIQTTYHKNIFLKSELLGTGEIIVENRSILDRITYKFRKVFIY